MHHGPHQPEEEVNVTARHARRQTLHESVRLIYRWMHELVNSLKSIESTRNFAALKRVCEHIVHNRWTQMMRAAGSNDGDRRT